MGDWNFVRETEDRLCLRTMDFTGRADKLLARNFQTLLDAQQLHELEQSTYTHENSTAQSKIDRIYTNHHVSDLWIDNSVRPHFPAPGFPLTSRSHLLGNPTNHKRTTQSRHNFLSTSYTTSSGNVTCISSTTKNYYTTHKPLRRLELLKQSMWDVATCLQNDTPPQANSTDDKLSWTMILIRAAQTINIRRIERAAAAYSFITTIVHAGDPNARIHPNFRHYETTPKIQRINS